MTTTELKVFITEFESLETYTFHNIRNLFHGLSGGYLIAEIVFTGVEFNPAFPNSPSNRLTLYGNTLINVLLTQVEEFEKNLSLLYDKIQEEDIEVNLRKFPIKINGKDGKEEKEVTVFEAIEEMYKSLHRFKRKDITETIQKHFEEEARKRKEKEEKQKLKEEIENDRD